MVSEASERRQAGWRSAARDRAELKRKKRRRVRRCKYCADVIFIHLLLRLLRLLLLLEHQMHLLLVVRHIHRKKRPASEARVERRA